MAADDLKAGETKGGTKPPIRGRHGGPRPGSGRKPSALKLALRDVLERNGDAGCKAFEFLLATFEDPKVPIDVRVRAAIEVTNRCWGKATSNVNVTQDGDKPAVDPEFTRRVLATAEGRAILARLAELGAQEPPAAPAALAESA